MAEGGVESRATSVMLVGLAPGVGELMAQWVRQLGCVVTVCDGPAAALDAARRCHPRVVICDGSVIRARSTRFADRLHQRTPRAGLIVVDSAAAPLAASTALDDGAVDLLIHVCTRERLALALSRAAQWAESEACRRREVIVRVNRRVRALERAYRRLCPVAASELRAWIEGRPAELDRQPAHLGGSLAGASRCAPSATRAPSDLGLAVRTWALAWHLSDSVARGLSLPRPQATALAPFARAAVWARVAALLGVREARPLCGADGVERPGMTLGRSAAA